MNKIITNEETSLKSNLKNKRFLNNLLTSNCFKKYVVNIKII